MRSRASIKAEIEMLRSLLKGKCAFDNIVLRISSLMAELDDRDALQRKEQNRIKRNERRAAKMEKLIKERFKA